MLRHCWRSIRWQMRHPSRGCFLLETKMPLQTLRLTIPKGQALSNGVDCAKGNIVMLQFPDAWDAANLSFQVSADGNDWRDFYYLNPGERMPMGLHEVVLPGGSNI